MRIAWEFDSPVAHHAATAAEIDGELNRETKRYNSGIAGRLALVDLRGVT